MELRTIIERQLSQARLTQSECAYSEDYVEAGVQSIRIEALEDALMEFDAQHVNNGNVVVIHG
jgi:hypothetical protein